MSSSLHGAALVWGARRGPSLKNYRYSLPEILRLLWALLELQGLSAYLQVGYYMRRLIRKRCVWCQSQSP